MRVNIDEIKKLPDEEKIKLIDELWESIENDWEKKETIKSTEVIHIPEKRED
ncbi:MAG: addiction module protein [Chitinophagaceae bacterium]|nr:addiction module protein [Chitinophagaceae bacterium]